MIDGPDIYKPVPAVLSAEAAVGGGEGEDGGRTLGADARRDPPALILSASHCLRLEEWDTATKPRGLGSVPRYKENKWGKQQSA